MPKSRCGLPCRPGAPYFAEVLLTTCLSRARQETDQEAEVAATLFDLAGLFEKADTVLEVEEHRTAVPGKRNLRKRITKPARLADADDAPAPSGRPSRGREAAQDARAASQRGENAQSAPAASRIGGDALPAELPSPWDPRNLQHLGLLPGGKPNPLLRLQPFPGHLPPGLAGFYPPSTPAIAAQMAAAQAAWPGMAAMGLGPQGEGAAPAHGADPAAPSTASAAKHGAELNGFRRCASHVFIAHFIAEEAKLGRQCQQAAQQAQAAKFGLNGMYQASRPPLNGTSSAPPMPVRCSLGRRPLNMLACRSLRLDWKSSSDGAVGSSTKQ